MLRTILIVLAVCFIGLSPDVQAQLPDAASLASALDKNKYKKKEKSKNGIEVSVEIYIDIKNVPAVREPAAYSGRYADDNGYSLDLKVAADGTAEGSGLDTVSFDSNAGKIAFTLRNGRVTGAVLTGDKVYSNGSTERLEAVFVNRTILSGKNASNIEESSTAFGLGFIQKNEKWTNRVFLTPR